MRKIPTVFVRDPNNRAKVIDAWHPDCLWVRDGEGVPTLKYDGTCVMFDGHDWWARRTVKSKARGNPAKRHTPPPGFELVEVDQYTGNLVGWEPAWRSPFAKQLDEALEWGAQVDDPGTFELCGPQINGNRERLQRHTLIRHSDAQVLPDFPRTFEICLLVVVKLALRGHEGIVWHHPDGRMAKFKGQGF